MATAKTRRTNWKGGRKEGRKESGMSPKSRNLGIFGIRFLFTTPKSHTQRPTETAALPYKLVTKSCGDRRVLTDPNISKLRDPHKMAEPITHTKSTIAD